MTDNDPLTGLCAYLLWLAREQPSGWEDHVKRILRMLLSLFTSGPLPGDDVRAVVPPPIAVAVDHLRREWAQLPLRRIGVDELAAAAARVTQLSQPALPVGVGGQRILGA